MGPAALAMCLKCEKSINWDNVVLCRFEIEMPGVAMETDLSRTKFLHMAEH